MPDDEAGLASERQVFDKGSDVGDYERRVAAEIITLITNAGADPGRILWLVDKFLHLPVRRPPGEDPRHSDAA